MVYKISYADLSKLFGKMSENYRVYLPVDLKPGISAFKPYEEGMEMSRSLNTVRSAKDFFFPQVEGIADFKMNGKEIEINDIRKEGEDFVIFGCRACDAKSFEVLDNVFLADPVDSFYENRRKHSTVVTLACTKPSETCFCNAMNIDAAKPAGDVSSWIIDDEMFFEANTEKGEALVSLIKDLLTEGEQAKVDAEAERITEILKKTPLYNLSVPDLRGKQAELWDNPIWQEMSETCMGCGTCTFVCPTCQCFDIRDFNTNDGVKRYRCWDSCMYSDFTKMAAANPRLSQKERFRQRFMHKLCYYPENNNGLYSCVGCGRCLRKCPQNHGIVKVIKKLGGENA